jgi:hypothetical protein
LKLMRLFGQSAGLYPDWLGVCRWQRGSFNQENGFLAVAEGKAPLWTWHRRGSDWGPDRTRRLAEEASAPHEGDFCDPVGGLTLLSYPAPDSEGDFPGDFPCVSICSWLCWLCLLVQRGADDTTTRPYCTQQVLSQGKLTLEPTVVSQGMMYGPSAFFVTRTENLAK